MILANFNIYILTHICNIKKNTNNILIPRIPNYLLDTLEFFLDNFLAVEPGLEPDPDFDPDLDRDDDLDPDFDLDLDLDPSE